MREITYCLSCKKDARNIDPRIVKTKIITSDVIKMLYSQ